MGTPTLSASPSRASTDNRLGSIASTSRHCEVAKCVTRVLDLIRLAVAIALLQGSVAFAQDETGPLEPVAPAEGFYPLEPMEPPLPPADSPEGSPDAPLPGEAQFGTLRGLTLGLTTGLGYDDNVFRTQSDTKSDFFWNLQPSAYLDGGFSKHSFRLGYEGDYVHYFDYDSEDFYDQRFLGRLNLDLTRQVDLNLSGYVWYGHDARGSIGTRVIGSRELDLWRENLVRAELVVGREITRAQVIPFVEYATVRYLNNDQSDRDYNRQTFGVFGRWRFTPKFWGLAETGYSTYDHLQSTNGLDREEFNFLVGFGWDATAQTSGEVAVGWLTRDFDDSSRTTTTDPTYDIRINWTPKPYSKFTGYARRESIEDASGGVGSLLADTFGLRWNHAFTERLSLETGIDYTLAIYDSPRRDKYFTYDLGVFYTLNRWLQAGGRYEHTSRHSNVPGIDYQDNLFLLELRGSFEHSL